MNHIDPRLGHAHDGAMLLVGDVELVQRWLDRDEDELLILDTVETVLDHAELAAVCPHPQQLCPVDQDRRGDGEGRKSHAQSAGGA